MSIVRWGVDNSDVYAYERAGDRKLVCYGCSIRDRHEVVWDTWAELRAHFIEHRESGDIVPDFVFETIEWEIAHGGAKSMTSKTRELLAAAKAAMQGLCDDQSVTSEETLGHLLVIEEELNEMMESLADDIRKCPSEDEHV